jgi:hypothetical protein
MRKSIVKAWTLLVLLYCAFGAVSPLYAEIPPGAKWLQPQIFGPYMPKNIPIRFRN